MFLVDVDDDGLVRFGLGLPLVIFAEQHARAADAQFEAFAAHGFDQHAELELAAAGDFETVLVGGFGDLDRDVAFGFAHSRRSRIMRLVTLVPSRPAIGAVVDGETAC